MTVARLNAVLSLDAQQYHRGLRDAESQAQRSAARIAQAMRQPRNELGQFVAQGDKASGVLGSLAGAFSALGSVGGGALRMISGAFSSLAGVAVNVAGAALRTVADAFREVVRVGTTAAAVVGTTLAAAFAALGKTGIDMNLSIDGARAGLTALTGSVAAAEGLISKLREAAFSTQLSFRELLPIGTQLTAVYGPDGLGRVLPTIQAFDAVQKALGISSDGVQNALLGFRQMLSRDALMAEELNQMEENLAGANIRGILKSAFGTADTELLQDAGVTGRQVADAIVGSFLTRFGTAAKEAEGRLPVLLSGFMDAFNELGGGATRTALGMLESGLKPILEAFKSLAANERFVSALAVPFELLAAAVQKVGEAAPAFTAWLGEVVTRENVVNILAQIGGGVKTITDEIGGFLSRVTGGAGFASIWDAFGAAAKKALELTARAWGGVTGAIEYFAQNSDTLWSALVAGIDRVKASIEPLVGLMATLAGSQLLGGGGLIGGTLGGFLAGGMRGGPGGAPGGLGIPPPKVGGNPIVGWLWAKLGIDEGRGIESRPAADPMAQLVEHFRGLGRTVLGTGQDFAQSLIPAGLKDFGSGLLSHIGQSSQAAVDRIFGGHAANVAAAQKALNSALAPKAKGDELAPQMKLYGQGAGAQGGGGIVPALPDKKALEKVFKTWDAYYDTLREQARLTVAQVAGEVKARAEMEAVVPQLLSRLETLVLPALMRTKEGTEEHYRAQQEYFRLSREVEELRARAADEEDQEIRKQIDARRKAAEERKRQAQETLREAGARTNFAEALLQANPFLNDQQRMRGLVPALLQQFRAQLNPIAGESGSERFGRLTDATGIIQKINEAFGLNRGVALAGGGMLGLGDPRGADLVGQMLRMVDQAARQPLQPGGGSSGGTVNNVGLTFNVQGEVDIRNQKLRDKIDRIIDERLHWHNARGYPSPSY